MIYFLIPVFNEEANLELLCHNLISSLPDHDKYFVFSDDGSTDNSKKKVEKLLEGKNFIVLGDGTNHGPGYAFNNGFEWILKHSQNNHDKVVTMEADNTSDISILPVMIQLSELHFDLVLASVYTQGGGFEKTSFFRRFISFVANLLLRWRFDLKVFTLTSFYRVYSLELIKNIKKNNGVIIQEKGFLCMIEILIKAIRLKARIIEVPMVLYSGKRIGKSKMKVLKLAIEYCWFLFKKA